MYPEGDENVGGVNGGGGGGLFKRVGVRREGVNVEWEGECFNRQIIALQKIEILVPIEVAV